MDTGGPSREFWRLLLKGINDHYLRGEEDKRILIRNSTALGVSNMTLG